MNSHVRRTLAATGTTTLLAATLLAAPGAASAAAITCQGKTVTIDGTGQTTITGTAGDDVIAAPLGSTVSALAGDDTICVLTGTGTATTTIDAGDNKDSVDASAAPDGATVVTSLGSGHDTYTGGAAIDNVTTGAGDDTVTTASGNDVVNSGVAGQDNADSIALAAGDDTLVWHGSQAQGSKVDLGEGANTLHDTDGGVVSITGTSSKVERGGKTVLNWSGPVATYVVDSTATSAAFSGTNNAETFVIADPAAGATPTTLTVDMAGGDDTATIRSAVLDGSTWVGGNGSDRFQVAHNYGELALDLDRGEFETGTPDVSTDQTVTAFEHVDAVTAEMEVKGTHSPNTLNLQGCDVRAVGRAGDDVISYGVDIANAPAISCTSVKMVARGGKDADQITGSKGNDRLFGNRGDDKADAMGGDDVIFGGLDNDRLRGGGGNDKVRGGQGNDQLGGGDGDDRVQGDKNNDRLLGHGGNDTLVGGLGFDRANGGQGRDKCRTAERRWKCER